MLEVRALIRIVYRQCFFLPLAFLFKSKMVGFIISIVLSFFAFAYLVLSSFWCQKGEGSVFNFFLFDCFGQFLFWDKNWLMQKIHPTHLEKIKPCFTWSKWVLMFSTNSINSSNHTFFLLFVFLFQFKLLERIGYIHSFQCSCIHSFTATNQLLSGFSF